LNSIERTYIKDTANFRSSLNCQCSDEQAIYFIYSIFLQMHNTRPCFKLFNKVLNTQR